MSERFIDLIWLAVSLFVCLKSVGMSVGSFRSPGPGFLPFLSGAAVGVLAMMHLIGSVTGKQCVENTTAPWSGSHWRKVILCIGLLVGCAILLSRLGYLLVTFVLMTVLIWMGRGKSRIWIPLFSASVSVLTYVVFRNLLGIPLPKGIFGF